MKRFKKMTLKDANNITRRFIKNNKTYDPLLSSDWEFSIVCNKVCIGSNILDLNIPSYCSLEEYALSYAFNNLYKLEDNVIKGNYYLTSIGLVTEEEYFEAEDLIERYNTKIAKNELIVGNQYLSNKGKKYLYLGDLDLLSIVRDQNKLNKKILSSDPICYDVLESKLVYLSSLKLIENIGELDNKIDILLNRGIFKELYDYEFIEISTTIKNIEFYNINNNRLVSLKDRFIIDNEVTEFIKNNEETFTLKKKENKKEHPLSDLSTSQLIEILLHDNNPEMIELIMKMNKKFL